MSKFTKKLQELIEKYDVPTSKLAKVLGVDKEDLALVYDESIVLNRENYQELVKTMDLNIIEARELEKLFNIYVFGEDEYNYKTKIRDFLEQISFKINWDLDKNYFCENARLYKNAYQDSFYQYESQMSLILAIKRVVNSSLCNDEKTRIRLVYNFNNEYLLGYFYEIFSSYQVNLEITHLTTFGGLHNGDFDLNILSYLISLVLVSDLNYNCFYNNDYQRLVAGDFSNYMIVNEKTFIFDDPLSRGMLISDPGQVEAFTKKFDVSIKMFKPMAYRCDSIDRFNEIYRHINREMVYYSIEPGVYLNNFLTREMLLKYYNYAPDQSEKIADKMLKTLGRKNRQRVYKIVVTVEGLSDFVINGVNNSFPQVANLRYTVEERKQILEEMIEGVRNDTYQLNIINTKSLMLPQSLVTVASHKSGLFFTMVRDYGNESGNISFYLDDPALGKLFCDFIDSLKDDNVAYNKEDTLLLLTQMINGYLD